MQHWLIAFIWILGVGIWHAEAAQVVINTPTAPWQAGSIVEVTWAYDANAVGVPVGTEARIVLMKVRNF
jgi:hypothetical protein